MSERLTILRRAMTMLGVAVLSLMHVTVASTPARAAVASPTRISIVNGELRVLATPGRNSDLHVTQFATPGVVSISAPLPGGEFEAAAPCEIKSAFLAECPRAPITRFRVDADDGNDFLSSSMEVPAVISMGAGSDTFASGDSVAAQTIDLGPGDDRIVAGDTTADNVFGGPGTDVASYGGVRTPIIVRLDNLANDGPAGSRNNLHTDIENIEGGNGDDLLVGSSADNQFIGARGKDRLEGGGGNDVFISDISSSDIGDDVMFGGPGVDTMDYGSEGLDLAVSLDDLQNDGFKGTDNVHTDVEVVLTGSGDDTLIGSSANNLLRSGSGRDVVSGGGGNDVLDGGNDPTLTAPDFLSGGSGNDTVTYSTRTIGVMVTLDNVPNDGEPGERDNVLTDVENALGGVGDDILVGSSAANILRGLGGNDDLNGGSGNDSLEGGPGTDALFGSTGLDTATYLTHPVGVAVSLDNKANDGRPNEADNVRSDVENVRGSNHNDTILGSSAANVLRGGAGNDRLFGRAGNDSLIGDSGTDQGFGDAGRDTCTTERKTSCP